MREKISGKKNVKVGKTYFGIYGSIGQVELALPTTGSVSLVGIVHIPKQIFPFVELIEGEEGIQRFYNEFFKQTEGNEWKGKLWNIREQDSNIDSEDVKRIPFISQRGYHWKLEKVRSNIFEDGRSLEEQVGDYENAVKGFIGRIDTHIHRLSPISAGSPITYETAKEHYNRLQLGEIKLIGQ